MVAQLQFLSFLPCTRKIPVYFFFFIFIQGLSQSFFLPSTKEFRDFYIKSSTQLFIDIVNCHVICSNWFFVGYTNISWLSKLPVLVYTFSFDFYKYPFQFLGLKEFDCWSEFWIFFQLVLFLFFVEKKIFYTLFFSPLKPQLCQFSTVYWYLVLYQSDWISLIWRVQFQFIKTSTVFQSWINANKHLFIVEFENISWIFLFIKF